MNKGKKVLLFIINCSVLINMFSPMCVFAFEEDGIKLNINTSSIEVKDAWQQIKNAARIQQIAQKMEKCVAIGQTLDDNTRWPAKSKVFGLMDGVLDTGNVFKGGTIISFDLNTSIGVGPWMSSLFGNNSGTIHCNKKTTGGNYLSDVFMYVVKNYKAGLDAASLANPSVNESDRLRLVCNAEDPTKPGLLRPADSNGNPTDEACNAASWYIGRSKDEQLDYIGFLYDDMVDKADNNWLLNWSEIRKENYDGVNGFYLYSEDFKKQCGGSTWSETGSGKKGYKIDDNGIVKEGFYSIQNDTSAQSFVNGKLTCSQLVDEMNSHLGEYLKFVNEQVLSVCEAGVTSVIEDKRREVGEKYSGDGVTDEQRADIDSLFGEYDRIVSTREYMAVKDGDNETLLTANQMPTDRVWQCRSHLPFVDITVQHEDSIDDVITNEFHDYCYDVMDLAWVVCPVVGALSDAADGLQEKIGDFFHMDFLQINSSLYKSGNTPSYLIWQIMQGFANSVMIIILLLIIVSQITGIGIDNYGIKKMLPKLIVMAVLINLSFVICQLVVDLSNIVGDGLISAGGEIARQVGGELSMNAGSLTFGAFFTALFGTAAGASVVAPIAIEVLTLSGFGIFWALIPLIFAALIALISVVIFLLLLGARQLLAVVLVAIAPLALVCYILPNTEKLFKKWTEMFKAVLIVYPVCCSLYVVSRLVQIVAWNSEGMHPLLAMVALIAAFVPLGAAPMLVKKSLAAFGDLGNMISRFGEGTKKGVRSAQSVVQNSEQYKYAQRQSNARWRAGISRDGTTIDPSRMTKLGRLMRGNESQIQLARASYANEKMDEYSKLYSTYDFNALMNESGGRLGASWYNPNELTVDSSNKMAALLKTMEANGMQNQIYDVLRRNNVGSDSRVMQTLAGSKDKVLRSYGKNGHGEKYDTYMRGGGQHSIRQYVGQKGTDFLKDIDDKSLGEISRYNNDNNEIMDTSLLVSAAATIDAPESLQYVNRMLEGRNDIGFSGAENVGFNKSTLEMLERRALDRNDVGSQTIRDSFISASDAIANSPELNAKFSREGRTVANNVRRANGLPEMGVNAPSQANSDPIEDYIRSNGIDPNSDIANQIRNNGLGS